MVGAITDCGEASDNNDSSSNTNATDGLQSYLNDLIGLEFVDGRVLYCHRSTLVNAGGLLAARFGHDRNMSPGLARSDQYGRSIYFMERDGDIFSKYILPFIITKSPGQLSPFSQDPGLWRALREEADFFALDDLTEILHTTHSCPYSKGNDQGILYWLGAEKGRLTYQNPQASGAIAVYIGRVGDWTFPERYELCGERDMIHSLVYTKESKQALVQYRPAVVGKHEDRETYDVSARQPCYSLWCHLSRRQVPTIIDLKTIQVRLTDYSLRYDRCGMTDWNLEGSNDGIEWTVLHEARNDPHIAKPTNTMLLNKWARDVQSRPSTNEKLAISQEFAERELRHTWQIEECDTFYRYFQIIGSGSDYERDENSSCCLHGVGLELYGEIHED